MNATAPDAEECENCQGHGVYWWLDDEGDERESECEHCKGQRTTAAQPGSGDVVDDPAGGIGADGFPRKMKLL